MRIIAGEAKGKILASLKGTNTRPTSDKVKESLFSIIQNKLIGSTILDLFAGTGNLGFEAISRGACKGVFVDSDKNAVRTIHKNCDILGYKDRVKIYRSDAITCLGRLSRNAVSFDIVFIDPPYHKHYNREILSAISNLNILHKNGIIVFEHDSKDLLPDTVDNLHCYDRRKYGGTGISFYKKG